VVQDTYSSLAGSESWIVQMFRLSNIEIFYDLASICAFQKLNATTYLQLMDSWHTDYSFALPFIRLRKFRKGIVPSLLTLKMSARNINVYTISADGCAVHFQTFPPSFLGILVKGGVDSGMTVVYTTTIMPLTSEIVGIVLLTPFKHARKFSFVVSLWIHLYVCSHHF
jgi:hypothetical protein